MRSWQNFLDAALRMSAMLNRRLVETHQLTLVDVRLLDLLNKSPDGAARMGDLAEGLDVIAKPGHPADPKARERKVW